MDNIPRCSCGRPRLNEREVIAMEIARLLSEGSITESTIVKEACESDLGRLVVRWNELAQ